MKRDKLLERMSEY